MIKLNKRGEAFITKAGIGIAIFGLLVTFVAVFMGSLSEDYGRTIETQYSNNFNSVNSDLTDLQIESQQIQQSSGIDAGSQDIAQVQGVLSASEKAADSQTIIVDALNTIKEILPFDNFVFVALLSILAIAFIGAIIYIPLGRWV